MWDYFGGKLEPIDLNNAEYALARELYEELGISVGQEDIKPLCQNENEKMYYIFFPKYKTRELRLDEGAGFAWFSFEEACSLYDENEAKSLITPRANEHLEKLKKKVGSTLSQSNKTSLIIKEVS